MIDEGSYANIIVKKALEKMSLKAEPHPHPHNVNWVDKIAQSITQHCQIPIHMSSYENHVWYNVLDIDVAHLDITSLGRSNTYELVLKPVKPKSSIGDTKERIVTEKNDKPPCYLVTKTHFSYESPSDGSTPRSRNSRGLLRPPLGISPIAIVEPFASHLHKLHEHNTRQITISNYIYQSVARSHKRLQDIATSQ